MSALPCVKGWIANINALHGLWEDLHDHYGFKYLMTRRVTQDSIEHLFANVRQRGGNNTTPDAEKIKYCLRSIVANGLLSPPPN